MKRNLVIRDISHYQEVLKVHRFFMVHSSAAPSIKAENVHKFHCKKIWLLIPGNLTNEQFEQFYACDGRFNLVNGGQIASKSGDKGRRIVDDGC